MINFIQVGANEIESLWDDCIPLLQKSFDRLATDYDVADIKEQVLAEEMQLWIAVTKRTILGCVITVIIQHPKNRVLNVVNLGGQNLPEWVGIMDTILTGFALANKCRAVRAWTRRGFSKLVPDFVEDGAIYVKLLGDK